MKGMLRVVERASRGVVATLYWSGTLWAGAGRWEADVPTTKRLEAIVASRADLAGVSFSDMLRDGYGVQGWQGFSGWLQALGLALPAYGLDVDAASIEWPFQKPAPGSGEGGVEGDLKTDG